jgi:hypothetical protein
MRQPRTLCCFRFYYLLEDYHIHKKKFYFKTFL